MANYMGSARSNYFKVNDIERFEKFCSLAGLKMWESTTQSGEKLVAVAPDSYDDGGFDMGLDRINEISQKEIEEDYELFDYQPGAGLAEDIAKFLAPNQVCILMEVGAEKLRYLNAYASVVNSEGIVKDVNLNHMAHEIAKGMTNNPEGVTYVEY